MSEDQCLSPCAKTKMAMVAFFLEVLESKMGIHFLTLGTADRIYFFAVVREGHFQF